MDQQQQAQGQMSQLGIDQQQSPIQPPIEKKNISLSLVIHRLVEQSYNNLLGLTEGLPRANDQERKKALLDYLDGTREKFLRLMVLIKWSEHVPTLIKANEIIDVLNTQDSYLTAAADKMFEKQSILVNARAPIYDIPTAIDVLTTGTYQRMPTNIKKVIPPPTLKPNQINSALERLDDIIKYKLFISDVPKEFQPIQVCDGKAHIIVNDEYEATLTIDGGSEKSNWLVLSLNLFVYSKRNLNGEGPIKVAYDNKMKFVLDRVQNRITSSAQPLFELHNIVHYLCVSSQMDILASQVENLKKTILKNNIRHVFGKDQSITVFYWLPEDLNLVGGNASNNLNPLKNTNFKIYIDEQQKIKISHFPPISHPKNDNYFNIANLNIETILLQAIELNAYHKVHILYTLLLDNRITSSSGGGGDVGSNSVITKSKPSLISTTANNNNNNALSRSFHLNDIKLIMSSRFSDENDDGVNNSNGDNSNGGGSNNDHLPTVLRVMLYGSKFLDITVNFQNGKFSLIKSSNYIENTVHLEQRLNKDTNEIKTIVNVFKLKSLLTCFEEASLFLGLECFNKIPLQLNNPTITTTTTTSTTTNPNQIVSELFSDSNFICISLPKENDPYLVISIKASCFTPSFHLLFCKLIPKSTIMTLDSIIKLENDSLNNLLKDCPIGSISSSNNKSIGGNGPFQNYISTLLEKIVEASNQKVNLLSIQSFLTKESISFSQPPSSIINSSGSATGSGSNIVNNIPSVIFLFNDAQIQKISPFLVNHISNQTPITISFVNGCYNLSFTQTRPFEYSSSVGGINNEVTNYHYKKGDNKWLFKYPSQNGNWFNSFCNDLSSISKITNISTQLLKHCETLNIFKQCITNLVIKPMSVEFICYTDSDYTRTNVRFYVGTEHGGPIKLSFQPYSNPLIAFIEKDINQSPTNDITNGLRAIINSNDISAYISSLTSPLELSFYLPLEILVIPRSIGQIRLLYKNLYGIDIKLISHEHCVIGDSFYSLNSNKQVRLTSISQLHLFMEQRIALQALDNPMGARTTWLLPIKQFQKVLLRIFIYLHSLNTLKHAQILVKPYFQQASNASSQRFFNEHYNISFTIRDYTSFDIEIANRANNSATAPIVINNSVGGGADGGAASIEDVTGDQAVATTPIGPTNDQLGLFCRYFKKRVLQSNYRPQTIASCIQIMTLPPPIFLEVIRVLIEITGPKFEGLVIEISLNTSNTHFKGKEAFVHQPEEHQVYFILRYLNYSDTTIPLDKFIDIPIIYNYKDRSTRYWNKLESNPNNNNNPPKPLSPIEEQKSNFINQVNQLVLAQTDLNSPVPNTISLFFKLFIPNVRILLSTANQTTITTIS